MPTDPPPITPPSERPRDELGRPLPPGSETRLHLPAFDLLPLDENHRLGIEFFDAGNYFGAHEAWETCWIAAKGTDEQEFFKGLAQLGAGYTHWARGNAHGADALLGRALSRIRDRGTPHRGIDIDALERLIELDRTEAAAAATEGRPLPELGARSVPRS